MYLGGFVVECLLKAKLLEKYGWLGNAAFPADRSKGDQRIWSLCYRSHDLDEILEELPEVTNKVRLLEQKGRPLLIHSLKALCTEWTIYARYSPLTADTTEAGRFLDRVEEIKQWLR